MFLCVCVVYVCVRVYACTIRLQLEPSSLPSNLLSIKDSSNTKNKTEKNKNEGMHGKIKGQNEKRREREREATKSPKSLPRIQHKNR